MAATSACRRGGGGGGGRGGGPPRPGAAWPRFPRLPPRPIRYIIDTSADPDHVGGNETLSKAGQTLFTAAGSIALPGNFLGGVASILSAEKVLSRMSAPTGRHPRFQPARGRPRRSITRGNTCSQRRGHRGPASAAAHTDGDAVVFFRRSDVVVAGDVLDTRGSR